MVCRERVGSKVMGKREDTNFLPVNSEVRYEFFHDAKFKSRNCVKDDLMTGELTVMRELTTAFSSFRIC